MEAVKDAGLCIPEDSSIAGIDDVHESPYTSPRLTTYHVPKRALGEAAVAALHALLETPEPPTPAKIALAGHIIVRDSCSAPRPPT
jgi:DNA-binding LacI/PurR family transcriptional regulator